MTDTCQNQIITQVERTQVIVQTGGEQGVPGPRGPAGPAGESFQFETAIPITKYSVVSINSNAKLIYASADDISFVGKVLGLSYGNYAAGEEAEVLVNKTIENVDWSWNVGSVFVGINGAMTQDTTGLVFIQCIGQAINPTTILINKQAPIIKG